MSAYGVFEAVVIAAIVGWSLHKAWHTLAPLVRTSLQRRESAKACGSGGCSGCEPDSKKA